jgi:transposase
MCLNEGGLKEVAQRLGMSEACAAVKACNMRKAGYDIPKLRRGRPRKIQE